MSVPICLVPSPSPLQRRNTTQAAAVTVTAAECGERYIESSCRSKCWQSGKSHVFEQDANKQTLSQHTVTEGATGTNRDCVHDNTAFPSASHSFLPLSNHNTNITSLHCLESCELLHVTVKGRMDTSNLAVKSSSGGVLSLMLLVVMVVVAVFTLFLFSCSSSSSFSFS
ncbi:hypothetical protein E2C01_036469 [Portunus trituberculatus]|uniref:Uncharacterized protein n=1 Tax=Portunus trituberculatus TaxID=210409 RepID=A0A5B7FCJ7_PORTR|nr:hypothetical protein [Portunus trituberculatus]